MFALNHFDYPKDMVVSQATSLPVLNDTKAAQTYGLLGVPDKDYVYIWDKQGLLASYFAPWQITLTNPANVTKLKELLGELGK